MPRIGLYLTVLGGGGTERFVLNLAEEFVSRGHQVDLVHHRVRHEEPVRIPRGVRLVELEPAGKLASRYLVFKAVPQFWRELILPVLLAPNAGKNLPYFPGFVEYLRAQPPAALIATSTYPNLFATWAKQLTRAPTRLILTEHNTLSAKIAERLQGGCGMRTRYLPPLIGRSYAQADTIVAVSDGVANDLATLIRLDRRRITVIYNPVVDKGFAARAAEPAPHPWLSDGGAPVILAVGRLDERKDYPTLIAAFARLRAARPARLLILGEGPLLPGLEAFARQLNVAEDVHLAGYVPNSLPYMLRAAVFALSSRYEGLPTVLIEALACGCPVVSTDSAGDTGRRPLRPAHPGGRRRCAGRCHPGHPGCASRSGRTGTARHGIQCRVCCRAVFAAVAAASN